MRNSVLAVSSVVGLLVLTCAASIRAISSRATAAAPATIADIAGTYELTRRVMSNGEEIHPPAIVALGRHAVVRSDDQPVFPDCRVGCLPTSGWKRLCRSACRAITPVRNATLRNSSSEASHR